MIRLQPCPKGHTREADKVCPPSETVARARERLEQISGGKGPILHEVRRADVGRLGIPVFMSMVGAGAADVMPTRKQMGKGATPEQAEASALMELAERVSFFRYWQRDGEVCSWNEAVSRFGDSLLPLAEIARSVGDDRPQDDIARMLNLVEWDFRRVTDIAGGREFMAPLSWFRKLGEFNGTSAGNTTEESLLQGGCELIERHACAMVDKSRQEVPTIDLASITDPVLLDLVERFTANGIFLILKDFSQGMGVPTVGALAYDPATFPARSEIVFTAGTASSPVKAAVRAVTEVAQLAGDFITQSCYEASGLPKFYSLADIAWLLEGPSVPLGNLPTIERDDIRDELLELCACLQKQDITLYAVETTDPEIGIPAHYCFAPGLRFRERDANASVGLFVGRILAEEGEDFRQVERGLALCDKIYDGAHFTPFFQGLLAMRQGDEDRARGCFLKAATMQPDNDAAALSFFYLGYSFTRTEEWEEALGFLDEAVRLCPEMKEFINLRGVCRYRLEDYRAAAEDFRDILKRLDKGSVMDRINLGACHLNLGELDQARTLLESVLETDPANELAKKHLDKLEALAKKGR